MDSNGSAALEHKGSVKRDDYQHQSGGVIQFIVPAYGLTGQGREYAALPQMLPAYNRYVFYSWRDWVLLATPGHEGMWANAVAVATTKAAAWGWSVESAIPLRRKRAQQLLLTATAGVFMGFVPFINAHIRSFLLTGKAVVEIERETTRYSSRIVALHHLNPLRCRFTDNPHIPVEYMDREGKIHQLHYWQVLVFGDNLSPTEGERQLVESAAQRVYRQIATMEAVHTYLYEKVSGRRALSLEFVQGLTVQTLTDAIAAADNEQERKGTMLYKGVVVVPIPGDVPVQRVSIPVAEVPDGFDYQAIHDNTVVDYADGIGMDVNDLDPRVAAARNLGAGAQSIVLMEKAKGKGLAAWKEQWTHQMNMWVLDDATKFTWSEDSLDDEKRLTDIRATRANTRRTQVEMGEITAAEARNLAVDTSDLPAEFLEKDITQSGALESDDKQTPAASEVNKGVQTLLQGEKAAAWRIAEKYAHG